MKISTGISNIFKINKLKSVLLIVLVWQIINMIVGKDYLVPSPFETLQRLLDIIVNINSLFNILITLWRMVFSFLLSFIFGIVLGVLSGVKENVEEILKPFVNILRSTPTMSIILLSLIWLGSEGTAIFVCVLIVFPIVYTNILKGMKNINNKYIEMAMVYKVSNIKILRYIYIPSIMPFLISSISLGLGLNLKVLIAAEVLSQPKYGIGSMLYNSKINIDTSAVFAWSIIVILITIIIEKLY